MVRGAIQRKRRWFLIAGIAFVVLTPLFAYRSVCDGYCAICDAPHDASTLVFYGFIRIPAGDDAETACIGGEHRWLWRTVGCEHLLLGGTHGHPIPGSGLADDLSCGAWLTDSPEGEDQRLVLRAVRTASPEDLRELWTGMAFGAPHEGYILDPETMLRWARSVLDRPNRDRAR